MSPPPPPTGPISHEVRERLFRACADHFVAGCVGCSSGHRLHDLAADVLAVPVRFFLCPLCRADLAQEVVEHMLTCPIFEDPAAPANGST